MGGVQPCSDRFSYQRAGLHGRGADLCLTTLASNNHNLQKPVVIPHQLTKLFIPKPKLLHNVTATCEIIVIPQVYLLHLKARLGCCMLIYIPGRSMQNVGRKEK